MNGVARRIRDVQSEVEVVAAEIACAVNALIAEVAITDNPDVIRRAEMVLASACASLAAHRAILEDPEREARLGDEFGGFHEIAL